MSVHRKNGKRLLNPQTEQLASYLLCLFSEKAHVYEIIQKNQFLLEVKVTKCIHVDTFKKFNATHIGERLVCS
jgi:hypothetical protein